MRTWLVILLASALLLCFGCEEKAWEKTRKAGTVEAFQSYLKHYPEGLHVPDAWLAIEQVRLGQAVKENTVAAYEGFLKDFPRSKGRPTAVQYLMRVVEPEVRALTPQALERMSAELETSHGTFRFRFFGRDAPETCRNFIKLARSHFYDGLFFFRVLPGQLIQAGAPNAAPGAGPGYTIKAELNDHLHVPGAVAMHHDLYPDSAGSQFYICLANLPERDRQFTVFGQVTEGMETIAAIGQVQTNGPEGAPVPDRPLEDVIIKRVTILTPSEAKP